MSVLPTVDPGMVWCVVADKEGWLFDVLRTRVFLARNNRLWFPLVFHEEMTAWMGYGARIQPMFPQL
jgi:hypothetical protein